MPAAEAALVRRRAAWSCPRLTARSGMIRDHVAFCAAAMDAGFVEGEQVESRPGGFYGGWISSAVAGPFEGIRGSPG